MIAVTLVNKHHIQWELLECICCVLKYSSFSFPYPQFSYQLSVSKLFSVRLEQKKSSVHTRSLKVHLPVLQNSKTLTEHIKLKIPQAYGTTQGFHPTHINPLLQKKLMKLFSLCQDNLTRIFIMCIFPKNQSKYGLCQKSKPHTSSLHEGLGFFKRLPLSHSYAYGQSYTYNNRFCL